MRSGLRVRGSLGDPIVRDAFVRFAKWLRLQYEFPVRVPVYLYPGEYILASNGEKVAATFFGPYSKDVEPYIRIATGGYADLLKECGRDDALASYILSFAHEIIHYFQWVKTGQAHEIGVDRGAVAMLDAYALDVDAP